MTIVIGTDEAGYGPNLGPLVVAASIWQVDAAPSDVESIVADAIAAATAVGGTSGRLWADSKQMFKAGRTPGLAALEHGALVAVGAATGSLPNGWHALADFLQMRDEPGGAAEWPLLAATSLPLAIDAAACRTSVDRVRDALADAGVSLCGVACRAVQPRLFNSLLSTGRNKSDILSQTTLTLAAEMLAVARSNAVDAPAVIWCDRHGGRKSYAAIVSRHFDSPLVQPITETPASSIYDVPAARCRIEFSVGGESRGPVALASMTAKYVREVAMHAFNRFWAARAPGLTPTAGYPVDAVRWRRDAAAAIRAAGIADDDLWRRA